MRMVKKMMILIILTAVVFTFSIVFAATSQGQLVLSETTVDLGNVKQGEVKTWLVTLQNGGTEVLEIKSVDVDRADSGVVVSFEAKMFESFISKSMARQEKNQIVLAGQQEGGMMFIPFDNKVIRIQPKSECQMQLSFNFEKTENIGEFTRTISIGSSDPETPLTKLTISGKLVKAGL